jgi:hypothetical protein
MLYNQVEDLTLPTRMASLLCACAAVAMLPASSVPPMNTRRPYLLANANITPVFRGEYFGE